MPFFRPDQRAPLRSVSMRIFDTSLRNLVRLTLLFAGIRAPADWQRVLLLVKAIRWYMGACLLNRRSLFHCIASIHPLNHRSVCRCSSLLRSASPAFHLPLAGLKSTVSTAGGDPGNSSSTSKCCLSKETNICLDLVAVGTRGSV